MPMQILLFIAFALQLNHWTQGNSPLSFFSSPPPLSYKKSGTGRECNNTLQKIFQIHHFPVSTSKKLAASQLFSQAETAIDQTVFCKPTQVHGRNFTQSIGKNCTKKRTSLRYRSVPSTTFLFSFFHQCYRYLQWWYLENFINVGGANKRSPF